MSPIKKLIAAWIIFCVPAFLFTYVEMLRALWEQWGYWSLLVLPVHVTVWYEVGLMLDSLQKRPLR